MGSGASGLAQDDDPAEEMGESPGKLLDQKQVMSGKKLLSKLAGQDEVRGAEETDGSEVRWDPSITKEHAVKELREACGFTKEMCDSLKKWADAAGNTRLHLAAAQPGRTRELMLLVVAGANARAPNRRQDTPLHVAARAGGVGAVELLAHHAPKVEVDARARDGVTALHCAATEGRRAVCEVLLARGADLEAITTNDSWTPLLCAVTGGQIGAAKTLVEHGADVNASSKIGETVLHFAASDASAAIVRYGLERGADPAATTQDGYTALHNAARNGNLEVVELLIENGADLAMQTKYGITALHVAASKGHAEVAQLCAERGPEALDAATPEGWTPLHWAVAQGHAGVVRVLVQCGASVNSADQHGHTPLHDAVLNGRSNLMQQLFEQEDLSMDVANKARARSPCEKRASFERAISELARARARRRDSRHSTAQFELVITTWPWRW